MIFTQEQITNFSLTKKYPIYKLFNSNKGYVWESEEYDKDTWVINGIINDLTLLNFDILSNKLIDILKETNMHKNIIELIYNKSIEELDFIELYIKLLNKIIIEFPHYTNLIILKCEIEFNNYSHYKWLNPVKFTKLEATKLERKVLGNIHFIVAMYTNGIISRIIIDQMILILLKDTGDETIEILSELITLLKRTDFDINKYKLQLLGN